MEEGGETILPLAHAIDEGAQRLANPSACARKGGISVRPHKGDALLIYDMDHMGGDDRATLHASCPTLKVREGCSGRATGDIERKLPTGCCPCHSWHAPCEDPPLPDNAFCLYGDPYDTGDHYQYHLGWILHTL